MPLCFDPKFLIGNNKFLGVAIYIDWLPVLTAVAIPYQLAGLYAYFLLRTIKQTICSFSDLSCLISAHSFWKLLSFVKIVIHGLHLLPLYLKFFIAFILALQV